jgi:hypothetical protein
MLFCTGVIDMKKKEVVWRWDLDCYMSFCPYCDEPTYNDDRCEFCGREYIMTEPEYKPTVIEQGEYTIVQCTNNNIHIYKGARMVYHASCTEKMSEKELLDMFKDLYDQYWGISPCEDCVNQGCLCEKCTHTEYPDGTSTEGTCYVSCGQSNPTQRDEMIKIIRHIRQSLIRCQPIDPNLVDRYNDLQKNGG